MKTHFKLIAVIAILAISGFSVRTALANSCSTNGCTINLSGHININNNWWGVAMGGASGSQYVWTSGANNWGSVYNWNKGSNQYQVKTYAEAIDGWNWGSSFNGGPFPKQLSSNYAENTGADNVYAGGTEDTIWDSFFSYSSNPGGSNPSHELEVWETATVNPSGYKYNATVDGINYNVYESYGNWGIIAYVPSYRSSMSVNTMDIARNAASHGLLSYNEYLLNIDFGTEVYYGNSSMGVGTYWAP